MKTVWDWSIQTESERIVYVCANIANGFYAHQGYLVLPNTDYSKELQNTVYLPTLKYDSIPRFWDKVQKLNMDKANLAETTPFIPTLTTMLEIQGLKSPYNQQLEIIWKKYGNKIYENLCKILNRKSTDISTLHIHWSHYGTNASFVAPHHFPSALHIYLRQDAGLHTLVETLTTAFIYHQLRDHYQATWKQIKLMSDWVVKDSSLASLLNKLDPMQYSTTLQSLASTTTNKRALATSTSFLAAIHAPQPKLRFQSINNQMHYNNKPLLYLTERENVILQELIKSTPSPVSIDTIADLIFVSPEDFSLHTITKSIEHLRNKLEKNGISSSRLKTHYRKGYSLH